jgi:hypothetical protein
MLHRRRTFDEQTVSRHQYKPLEDASAILEDTPVRELV